MRSLSVLVVSLAMLGAVVEAQLIFPDGSTQSSSADFRNVVRIDSAGQTSGNQTNNGNRLRNALAAIAEDNATPTLLLLGSGTFNIGATPLAMKPEVTIRGTNETKITGTGSSTILSTVPCRFEQLEIVNTTDGSVVVALSGAETEMRTVDVRHTGASASETSVGIQVSGGGKLEMIDSDVEFRHTSAQTGTFIGILLVGESDDGSSVELRASRVRLEDPNEAMFLTGIQAGAGINNDYRKQVELHWSNVDVFGGDGRVNGITVASDGELNLLSSVVLTESSSGDFDGTNAVNNSGEVSAMGTLFQGARIDNEGSYHYAHCAEIGGSGLRPITDTLLAQP